jgi:hypothetical protein
MATEYLFGAVAVRLGASGIGKSGVMLGQQALVVKRECPSGNWASGLRGVIYES